MSLEKFNQAQSDDVNLTDGTSLAKEKKAIQDSQDLESLRELRKATWFKTYYERRLKEERESLCRDLLNEHYDWSAVVGLRHTVHFIDKLLAMPESDRFTKFQNLHPNQKIQPED